jgi:hypothetical protein
MRKLKLELDELQVESFDVQAKRLSRRGTVRGAAPDEDNAPPDTYIDNGCYGGWGSGNMMCLSNSQCVQQTPCNTCWQSCNGTCAPPGQMCA